MAVETPPETTVLSDTAVLPDTLHLPFGRPTPSRPPTQKGHPAARPLPALGVPWPVARCFAEVLQRVNHPRLDEPDTGEHGLITPHFIVSGRMARRSTPGQRISALIPSPLLPSPAPLKGLVERLVAFDPPGLDVPAGDGPTRTAPKVLVRPFRAAPTREGLHPE